MRRIFFGAIGLLALIGLWIGVKASSRHPVQLGASRAVGPETSSGWPLVFAPGNAVMDGKPDEWGEAPPLRCEIVRSRAPEYGIERVCLAADADNVYLLLELRAGVAEVFQSDRQSGRVRSKALGHFYFSTATARFKVWLPTGFTHTFDESPQTAREVAPLLEYHLYRQRADQSAYDLIVLRDSQADANAVSFDGQWVELRFPRAELGLAAGDGAPRLRVVEH